MAEQPCDRMISANKDSRIAAHMSRKHFNPTDI